MSSQHLSEAEARDVLTLSTSSEWASFKAYIVRRYANARAECMTRKDDHRYYQGGAFELSEIVIIEEKAKNILGGV